MADQQQGYIPPEYSNTPVVSPTESITFSDHESMGHPHHYDVPVQLNMYAGQNPYPPDQRWYQQGYSLEASAGHQNMPNLPHQQQTYGNVGSHALPVTSNVPVPSGTMANPTAPSWVQLIPPMQQVQVASPVHSQVSHVPTNLLQPPQPWSHHQLPHGHHPQQQPESLAESRHGSISSTSVAGSMSTAPTAADELTEYGGLDAKPTPSPRRDRIPVQGDHQHYGGSAQLHQHQHQRQLPPQAAASSPSSPLLDSELSLSQRSESAEQPVRRKRGRPPNKDKSGGGGDAAGSGSGSSKASKAARVSRRQPHNQVERKYREGLNHEMEKLRQAIPQLPQGPVAGQKASKSQVLQGAVHEIERLKEEKEEAEKERDQYKLELERIKKKSGVPASRVVETS